MKQIDFTLPQNLGALLAQLETAYCERAFWQKAAHEWPSWQLIPSGVVVEDVLEDSNEFCFYVIWGKVVTFWNQLESWTQWGTKYLPLDFAAIAAAVGKEVLEAFENDPVNGWQELSQRFSERVVGGFDGRRWVEGMSAWTRDGGLVHGKYKVQPPWWWRIGIMLSEKIAALTLADAVRVDLFFHEGRVILNEYTLGPSGAVGAAAKDGGVYPEVILEKSKVQVREFVSTHRSPSLAGLWGPTAGPHRTHT